MLRYSRRNRFWSSFSRFPPQPDHLLFGWTYREQRLGCQVANHGWLCLSLCYSGNSARQRPIAPIYRHFLHAYGMANKKGPKLPAQQLAILGKKHTLIQSVPCRVFMRYAVKNVCAALDQVGCFPFDITTPNLRPMMVAPAPGTQSLARAKTSRLSVTRVPFPSRVTMANTPEQPLPGSPSPWL